MTVHNNRGVAAAHRAAKRVQHLQPLDGLDDPRLGLSPAALRIRFRGEPLAGWDDVTLLQLIEAAAAVWSRIIGSAATNRERVATRARLVALSAITGWVDPEGHLHAPCAVGDATAILKLGGWGGKELSWRKLAAYGEMDLRLESGKPDRVLRLESEWDYTALDMAWMRVKGTTHRQLPAPVLTSFLAGPRVVNGVSVPGILDATVLLVSWGPEAARRAMVRALELHAGKVSKKSLVNHAGCMDGFLRYVRETAPNHSVMCEHDWEAPTLSVSDELDAIPARPAHENERDVTSPGDLAARRALLQAHARVEQHRSGKGTLRPPAFSPMRRSVALNLQVATSGRIGMTADIRPCDVERDGVCGEYHGPLVWVFPNKNDEGRREPRPVHVEVVDQVDEFCALAGIPRDDTYPLIRTEGGKRMSGRTLGALFAAEGPRIGTLLPRLSGEGASSHTARHLGAQAAAEVAAAIIEANPSWRGAMDSDAVAQLWLGQTVSSDAYGYRDIIRNRNTLLVLIGAGDPDRGIAGVRDRFWGESGARKAWDDEAIRAEYEALIRNQERCGELRVQIAAVRADQDRLHSQGLNIAVPDCEPLPSAIAEMCAADTAVLRDMTQRELIERILVLTAESTALIHREQVRTREVIAAAHEATDARGRDLHRVAAEIERLRDSRHDAERGADRAEVALEKLKVRGPTRPIPDTDPTTAELRASTGDQSARAPEDESWQHVFERVSAHFTVQPTGPLRGWINIPELIALTGRKARTIQRYRSGESTDPLALGIQRARWADLGDKLAFVHADTLPLHLFFPTQLEFLAELRRAPMAGNHGGRRRSDAEIEAAIQSAPKP